MNGTKLGLKPWINIVNQLRMVELTMALKVDKEPLVCMDLWEDGIMESTKQIIEIHCPLFKESPTYTSLLFLSFSSNAVALNLFFLT